MSYCQFSLRSIANSFNVMSFPIITNVYLRYNQIDIIKKSLTRLKNDTYKFKGTIYLDLRNLM